MPSSRSPSRPTIIDVARDAGVSKTSVSRYFGTERTLLSESMRSRIEASIARLEFRPDRIASSLRGRKTGLIGMLVADLRNPYTVAMVHGAELACRERGYALVVFNTDNDDALERRHLDILKGYSIEGLIINTRGQNLAPLQQSLASGLPMVLVDRHMPGLECDMVGLDNAQAVALALSHLSEQGFQHVMLVTEPVAGISSREERVAAFDVEAGRLCLGHQVLEIELGDNAERLDCAVGAWLERGEHPRALLSANGVVTLALCQALSRLGAQSFERAGLIGIDELEWCSLVGPGISTIAQPVEAIGAQAVERLWTRIEGATDAPCQVVLEGELTPRGSTMAAVRP
ncbi:LacI family DNA-binding transcriptional regulator [Larsenimonas salina]|uniref:LacI family DNA-binding transcriptional regulator n=1 Tax=Larsenimonas salina TaxID=1295565 RepID=UPI002074423B|nr:substrate-binding domain-containing protein [Larsenimonas salina]MCM5705668.1 substrate-binding domain-containing protein [Larsenimonas salina]